jgi:PKD repeat protein
MKSKLLLLKKSITILMLLFLMVSSKSASACWAGYSHTNGCAGDTIWFYAEDLYAIYTWDFGDSTAQININHDTATFHVYNTPGTYYVTLFVNIGNYWDYRTQIITIGTDCFNADFSYQNSCDGSNSVSFTNTSVGDANSWLWDFGDPNSGINNTDYSSSSYHTFSAPGTYNVTLIASNGNMADTIVQTIDVTNCINATIAYNIYGDCFTDPTFINVTYSGSITSYSWDFGDIASGTDNTSTLANPSHIFSAPGVYNVQVTISDGTVTNTISGTVTIIDCTVWPGDCNGDGDVNAEDIFPLGIFASDQGNTRSAATTNYTSQASTDWTDPMYLQARVNKKHADCNGDGTLNATDMAAITANYGLRHNNHNNKSGMPEATAADPSMSIQLPTGAVTAGSTITCPISLGTSAIPISSLYGYSFTINYDAALIVPGSVSIDLSTNFLGNSSNELTITKDNYSLGKIDAAVVRTDKTQLLAGYGQIGTITFQIKPNVSGTLHTTFSPSAKVLAASRWFGTTVENEEVFIPVNLNSGTITVNTSTGITEYNTASSLINVYPNPANTDINIAINDTEATEISLYNALGEQVYTTKGNLTGIVNISLQDYAKGIYTLSCKTKNGIAIKKVSIVK